MRSCFACVVFVTLSALSGCAATPAASPPAVSAATAASSGDYKIAPGDVLNIIVYGHDDLSGNYIVNAEGNISMPLINQVSTSGVSTVDLESRLIEMLQPDYLRHPDVSVKLLSYRPIYVLGEVRNAGSFPYQPNMSVLSAIALAGGYTYRAAKKKLIVVRGDDESRQETRVTESSTLQPGDTVIIPQRLF